MKTLRLLLAAAAIALLMGACGNKPKENTESTAPKTETQAATDTTARPGLATIIDFSATWCGPCRQIAPYVHELAGKYKDSVNFRFVDVDEDPALANMYGVQSIPTFILVDADGKEISRVMGADPDALLSLVDNAAKVSAK